jgi:hypothetical protein
MEKNLKKIKKRPVAALKKIILSFIRFLLAEQHAWFFPSKPVSLVFFVQET